MLENVMRRANRNVPILLSLTLASLAFVGCSMSSGDMTQVRTNAASEVAKNNLAAAESMLRQAADGQVKKATVRTISCWPM